MHITLHLVPAWQPFADAAGAMVLGWLGRHLLPPEWAMIYRKVLHTGAVLFALWGVAQAALILWVVSTAA